MSNKKEEVENLTEADNGKTLIDLIKEENYEATLDDKKFYENNDKANASLLLQHWYENAPEGRTLFIVFYTKACIWNRCAGCTFPSNSSSKDVGVANLKKQIDYIFQHLVPKDKSADIKKIILSNGGSMLDERTFHSSMLSYLIMEISLYFPNLKKISLETRPEFCTPFNLEILEKNIALSANPDMKIELSIGFEIFDTKIRNRTFKKGLSFKIYEKLVELTTKYNISIKSYFMLKAVKEFSDEEAVDDIKKAIVYMKGIKDKYKADLSMAINATYAAKGTILEEHFYSGEWSPPYISDVVKLMIFGFENDIEIQASVNDEGLAPPGGSAIRNKDNFFRPLISAFNRNQDPTDLKVALADFLNTNTNEDETSIISELAVLKRETLSHDVILITPDLLNDTDKGSDIYVAVQENLLKGIQYTYIVPYTKEVNMLIQKYKNIYENHENAKFIIIPRDEFSYSSDTVIYDFYKNTDLTKNVEDDKEEENEKISVYEWKPSANNSYFQLAGFFKEQVLRTIKKDLNDYLEM